MLETPSIRWYCEKRSDNPTGAVNQQERPCVVQRRRLLGEAVDETPRMESSEAIRQPPHSDKEVKRWSEPYGDIGGISSEIPCRVSSDLHEWRNDLATVSTRDPAKFHDE